MTAGPLLSREWSLAVPGACLKSCRVSASPVAAGAACGGSEPDARRARVPSCPADTCTDQVRHHSQLIIKVRGARFCQDLRVTIPAWVLPGLTASAGQVHGATDGRALLTHPSRASGPVVSDWPDAAVLAAVQWLHAGHTCATCLRSRNLSYRASSSSLSGSSLEAPTCRQAWPHEITGHDKATLTNADSRHWQHIV